MAEQKLNRKNEICLVGLGRMGAQFARNLSRNGIKLHLLDHDPAKADALAAELPKAAALKDWSALGSLGRDGALILFLIPAGEIIDQGLAAIGDISGCVIADVGNSYFKDSQRRAQWCQARGAEFIDIGISGGPNGALTGPSLMLGGSAVACAQTHNLLEASAAKSKFGPCIGHVGSAGAGHFVKMVHNGIEYALLQLLAEIHLYWQQLCGWDDQQILDQLGRWQSSPLRSNLFELWQKALNPQPGIWRQFGLIQDQVDWNGSGTWAVATALEWSVPVPSLAASVDARIISKLYPSSGPAPKASPSAIPEQTFETAIFAAIQMIHLQGFQLLAAGVRQFPELTSLTRVAQIWSGGCVIQSALMNQLAEAGAEPLSRLIPTTAPELIFSILSKMAEARLPTPVLSSVHQYLIQQRTSAKGANLIQALRDQFGQHGFLGVDGVHKNLLMIEGPKPVR